MIKSLSIIIPCFNEEERLEKTIEVILAMVPNLFTEHEIILVNDGSTDGTYPLIQNLQKLHGSKKIKAVNLERNYGKGRAIRAGLKEAGFEWSLLCDADLSCPITEVLSLLPLSGDSDLIVGSRRHALSKVEVPQGRVRVLLGRCFSGIARALMPVKVSDYTCGFKLMRTSVAHRLVPMMKVDGWAYDAELLLLFGIHGFRVRETGVKWSNDPRSKVSVVRDVFRSFKELCLIWYRWKSGAYS